jgi:predicted kinase
VAVVWVLAGAPGAGKSTVSAALTAALAAAGAAVPAVLDKDTLFGGFVAEVLGAHARPSGEREGPWYDEHIKVHEYGGMTAAARQIRAAGCPVLLDAPFTGQIRDPQRWAAWVDALGGEPVRLVWVRSDADTVRRRLVERGSIRDTGKLDAFEAFVARMLPDVPPPVPHDEIDNRDGAPPVADQVAAVVARLLSGVGTGRPRSS